MEAREIPRLKTERLLLRQIVATDIDNIFKGLSDPEIIKFYGVNYQSLEATKEQMTFYADLEKNGTGMWFAICSLDNTVFYGAGGLNSLSREHKKAEIGFWLLKDFWGQGIMTEAIPLICNYGFNILGLHRIEGFVESKNLNSKRAFSKLDFRHEGTMIDCEMKNGKFISLDIYAKIKQKSSIQQGI
jgi:ribosomal-protein-alanine N-acetyltransferase